MAVVNAPEVSVLVVTYNQAATVGRAIESVIAQQTPFPFEIIVADDASTDGTADIARSYADRYPGLVRVVARLENVGLVENYFDALAQARGTYIADCAGDDWWPDPTRMAAQRDILAANPSMTLVHGAWTAVDAATGRMTPGDPDGANAALHPPVISGSRLLEPFFAHRQPQLIHLSTAMFRRRPVVEKLRADRGLIRNPEFGCEDFPLTAWLLAEGDVGYIDRPMLCYTVGHDSVSNPADPRRAFAQTARTLDMTLRLAEVYGVGRTPLDAYLSSRLEGLARFALASGDPSQRRQLAALAGRLKGVGRTRATSLLLAAARVPALWGATSRLRKFLHTDKNP